MNVYLDDQPIALERNSLACAIRTARQAAERSGRIIVEVLVNEIPVTGEELDHASDEHLGGASVRMISADPVELVATSADAGLAALENLCDLQAGAADAFRVGRIAEAVEQLDQVVGLWQSLADLSSRAAAITGEASHSNHVNAMLNELSPCLNEFRSTLANEDWVALADLLEYDLAEHAGEWRKLLRSLQGAHRADH